LKIDIKDIRELSIKDYLESRGVTVEQNGKKWFCSSPFSRDTNWSFCIYPSNTFYCWSTGKHGDIITLAMLMEGVEFKEALQILSKGKFAKYVPNYKKYKEDDDFWKDFDYTKYLTYDENEKKAIISYGQSRSISSGYHCGVYFTRSADRQSWVRNPAMMFLHQDKDGNICGAKFRKIYDDNKCDGSNGPRFSARGKLGFYILDTGIPETWEKKATYLCESETSSNSLWSYFIQRQRPVRIISMGGVSSAPKELPKGSENHIICLIIDYDGDEKLYQERLKQYEHLNVTPIKLCLPKGEDINSLYHRGEMYKIEQLLNN
jgi:hypothetical protein